MPKKRGRSFKHLQGTSSGPSKPAIGQHGGVDDGESTVNERLNQLRSDVDSSEAVRRQLIVAVMVNQRSVHPSLEGILGVPETAPPKPKPGTRTRDRMRTPGPPPPGSWLGYGPSKSTLVVRGGKRAVKRAKQYNPERLRPRCLMRFAHLTGEPNSGRHDRPSSLMHIALRTAAECWNTFDEQDYPALEDVPMRLRSKLLSYISFYGNSIDIKDLQALLQGFEDVELVDLAGLIDGDTLTLRKVTRVIQEANAEYAHATTAIADSWENHETSVPLTLQQLPRFADLTRLCLSHPPPTTSWRDLIGLSKQVPQLSHLSLAYWPRPTLTPNLSTATVSSQSGVEVMAGGSGFYSALDEDFSEPVTVLRILSTNLLRLLWLDLEGCVDWVGALGQASSPPSSASTAFGDDDRDLIRAMESMSKTPPTVLTTTWKNVSYLNIAQGWFPAKYMLDESDRTSVLDHLPDLTAHLRRIELQCEGLSPDARRCKLKSFGVVWEGTADTLERRAIIWQKNQTRLLQLGRQVRAHRIRCACIPLEIDYGYEVRSSGNHVRAT